MTLSRVKPLGWALFEELTSAQMNQLDENVSHAIDGVDGGLYVPSSSITIDGTMSITNLNVSNLTGAATFSSLTVTGPSDFNDEVHHHDTTLLGNTTTIQAVVNMTAGNFNFTSPSTFFINGGSFSVTALAEAYFYGDTFFQTGATVTSQSNWDFTGGTVTFDSGSAIYVNTFWRFLTRPQFAIGLQLDAGEVVSYSTSKSWVTRAAFALGASGDLDKFIFDPNGWWKQSDSSLYPTYLYCYPQGLWGGVAVNIVAAEFRAVATGVSGTPSGDTDYQLSVLNEDLTSGTTVTAIDPTPNSASDHSATWSGTVAYDPSIQILRVRFRGYLGGDVLNTTTKFYAPKTMRFTFSTTSKGYY